MTMSDKSTRPRSGEFTNLTSQRAQDGSLEYVLGDESSSPIEDDSPPRATPATSDSGSAQTGSRKPLILGVGVLAAIVVATVAFFASGDAGRSAGEGMEQNEQVSFKAYSGNAAPADKPPVREDAPEVDGDIPEELAGWDLDETDEEVIVIEEYDGEPEPAATAVVVPVDDEPAPGEVYTKHHERHSITANGRARYASPEQRDLLRKLNAQLDRGERPVIPKANMPSTLRPISPRMQNLDNITGPKFIPGKLHTPKKKENAQGME
jgi:hypothetical protein